jgi:hypothetical protein
MIRALITLYVFGIVLSLVLFMYYLPRLPLIDAVVGALLWPYGVYRYFIAG